MILFAVAIRADLDVLSMNRFVRRLNELLGHVLVQIKLLEVQILGLNRGILHLALRNDLKLWLLLLLVKL